ncbi:MAG: iron chelate uptake ABC transporter family permease subunit [Chloroflexi bacterium]|nr:iron chelate uptake ABC transporter family permease subunit [Chloroflexota bacterium]
MSETSAPAKIAAPLVRKTWSDDVLHRRSGARVAPLALGFLILVAIAMLSAACGAVAIPVSAIVQILLAKSPLNELVNIVPSWPASYETVILQIRLPRVLLAGLVGASLAVSGATYQALFRNPLADPYLIGVASGASLGAVLALVLPLPLPLYSMGVVQIAAFLAALLTIAMVYALAKVGRSTPVTTLLLAGVALGALASAGTSLLMYLNGDKLHSTYAWLLGGLALSSWPQVFTIFPYSALGLAVMILYARPLNVMQLNEEQAALLGINVERLKLILVAAATLATAAAVSVSGLIGFIGLIVPHAVRLIWGPDYRFLLPMSVIAGAAFLIGTDSLARIALAPSEIPVGAITAFCGAPFFLYLLRQKKRAVF